MNHRTTRKWNVYSARDATICANNYVLHLISPAPPVRHDMKLIRTWITLWVGRKRHRQRSFEVCYAHGVKLEVQLNRRRTCFNYCVGLSRVLNDICVGRKRVVICGPIRRWRIFAHSLRKFWFPHPTIAVPLSFSIANTNAVHHSVAREPVVLLFVNCTVWVWSVAYISTI